MGRSWSQKTERITNGVPKKTQRQMANNSPYSWTPTHMQSFKSKTDATRWATETELKIRREDAGIAKIHFAKFEDLARKYIEEISVLKKCHRDERYTILGLLKEAWSSYPINKIKPTTINKYKDTLAKRVSGSTVNRRLDVISRHVHNILKKNGVTQWTIQS